MISLSYSGYSTRLLSNNPTLISLTFFWGKGWSTGIWVKRWLTYYSKIWVRRHKRPIVTCCAVKNFDSRHTNLGQLDWLKFLFSTHAYFTQPLCNIFNKVGAKLCCAHFTWSYFLIKKDRWWATIRFSLTSSLLIPMLLGDFFFFFKKINKFFQIQFVI